MHRAASAAIRAELAGSGLAPVDTRPAQAHNSRLPQPAPPGIPADYQQPEGGRMRRCRRRCIPPGYSTRLMTGTGTKKPSK